MEKYAKLMKGLEVCAGPECGIQCPYHGETRGGKTCRAWLLNDAAAAIANEEAGSETLQELLQNAEAERDKLHADVELLEDANNAYRVERDKLAGDNMELRKECDMMATRCTVLQNEINALVLKMGGKHDGKTDRPSVCDRELMEEVGKLIAQAKYQEGKADALEWFLREWFREGGFQ